LNSQNIFIFGRSLGSGFQFSLLISPNSGCSFSRFKVLKFLKFLNFYRYQNKIKGVIVENAFTEIGDMIDLLFPAFKFVKFLSTNKWRNNQVVKTFRTLPILFISGQSGFQIQLF
jgi:hypothetical protein